eukprot:2255888-Pleurochrysis_carterae.AAC.1
MALVSEARLELVKLNIFSVQLDDCEVSKAYSRIWAAGKKQKAAISSIVNKHTDRLSFRKAMQRAEAHRLQRVERRTGCVCRARLCQRPSCLDAGRSGSSHVAAAAAEGGGCSEKHIRAYSRRIF